MQVELDPGTVDMIEAGVDRPCYGNCFWTGKLQRNTWRSECSAAAEDFATSRLAYTAGVLLEHARAWRGAP